MIEKIINTLRNQGVTILTRKAFLLIKAKLCSITPNKFKIIFMAKIRDFKSEDIDTMFDFSFTFLRGFIRPMQIKEEFKNLLKIFKKYPNKIILEIGTANGGSLFHLCKLAPDDALIISIDLPEGNFGGGYPKWKEPIYKLFKKKNQRLYLLREDSHQEETLLKIKEILNNKKIDFLFIDGDHGYDGVKKDFKMYSPLVKEGGIIAFHDITPNGLEKLTGGVPIFWREIKDKYEHEEFIQDQKQTGYGIGYLINK